MTVSDAVPLDRYLIGLEWTVHRTRRETLAPGHGLLVPPDRSCMVYVEDGAISLDGDRADGGDILLLTPQGATRLLACTSARVVLVELRCEPGAEVVLAGMPPRLVVRDFARAEPQMAALAATMGLDCTRAAPGGESTVCSRIVTAIIAVAMRTWSQLGCAPPEWDLGTSDPLLSLAVDAIHAEPSRAWTVAELASVATMSRSIFAERFRRSLGRSPAQYLGEVRMASARRHLGTDGLSVAETGRRLGYASEAGFTRAFTRHVGQTPSAWRRAQPALVV